MTYFSLGGGIIGLYNHSPFMWSWGLNPGTHAQAELYHSLAWFHLVGTSPDTQRGIIVIWIKRQKYGHGCRLLSDWVQLSASSWLTRTVQLGPLYCWRASVLQWAPPRNSLSILTVNLLSYSSPSSSKDGGGGVAVAFVGLIWEIRYCCFFHKAPLVASPYWVWEGVIQRIHSEAAVQCSSSQM